MNEQRTPEWHAARQGRITASGVLGCIGYRFCSREEYADKLRGRTTTVQNEAMLAGIEYEPFARQQYEHLKQCHVTEVGFMVPKFMPSIGASPDGLVGDDGMIEIKCPATMYLPLTTPVSARRVDSRGRPFHIWESHYSQMQMQLAIADRKWCDYVVYAYETGEFYVERVRFNRVYWDYLLAHIKSFITQLVPDLEPAMSV